MVATGVAQLSRGRKHPQAVASHRSRNIWTDRTFHSVGTSPTPCDVALRWNMHALAVAVVLGLAVVTVGCASPPGASPSLITGTPPPHQVSTAPPEPESATVEPATTEPDEVDGLPGPDTDPLSAHDLLEGGLRDDARVDCEPRHDGLPGGASAGIECRAEAPFVDRIGVYLIPDRDEASDTYASRLASYDIALDTGDCELGYPGDRGWRDDGEDFDRREGCFIDEYGQANLRFLIAGEYIGVVGHTGAIPQLWAWAWGDDPDATEGPFYESMLAGCTGCDYDSSPIP
jgi:hypothetical protein